MLHLRVVCPEDLEEQVLDALHDRTGVVAVVRSSDCADGAMVSADLDPRDATAGNGWGGVLGDLKKATTRGGMLYVFSLGVGK